MDGCRLLCWNRRKQALVLLRKSVSLADGAYLAGFVALVNNHCLEAYKHHQATLAKQRSLGQTFEKYQIDARILLPINDEISLPLGPEARTVIIGLIQACQSLKRSQETRELLQQAQQSYPEEIVFKLMAAEWLVEAAAVDRNALVGVVEMTNGVRPDSTLHCALLLTRARALRQMAMLRQAHDLLATVLKQAKELPVPLAMGLQYEWAMILIDAGHHARAAGMLETIHKELPGFKDVDLRMKLLSANRASDPPQEKVPAKDLQSEATEQ